MPIIRRMREGLRQLVLLSLAALLLGNCTKRATFVQELTVTLETPEGPRSFSSRQTIRFVDSAKWAGEFDRVTSELTGEAVVLDLGDRLAFVLLEGADTLFFYTIRARDMRGRSYADTLDDIAAQTGPLEVPRTLWPPIVTFGDPADPRTAMLLEPEALPVLRMTLRSVPGGAGSPVIAELLPWLGDPSLRTNPVWPSLDPLDQRVLTQLVRPLPGTAD